MSSFAFVSPLPLSYSHSHSHSSSQFLCPSQPGPTIPYLPTPNITLIPPTSTLTTPPPTAPPTPEPTSHPTSAPKPRIATSSVVEIWSRAQLCFAFVTSTYEKGIVATVLRITAGEISQFPDTKISFDEIVSVWPDHIPIKSPGILSEYLDQALTFLRHSPPRSLDLRALHKRLSNLPKHTSPINSSAKLAPLIFPRSFRHNNLTPETVASRRAIATIASAILVSSDSNRFKRASPSCGWRPLPASVVTARERTSFVNMCTDLLNKSTSRRPTWTREQIEILRDIQIVAASGTNATGPAATALRHLGYHPSDDGAAQFLLDIHVWGTGLELPAENNPAKTLPSTPSTAAAREKLQADKKKNQAEPGAQDQKKPSRDWAFPPEILAAARDLRQEARIARQNLATYCAGEETNVRTNFVTPRGALLRAYCIDDKNTRFLDDAVSVQVISSQIVRVSVHIADVDDIVRSSSAVDNLAKERGFSLYLPLKPLHMLPAAVMEAASFSISQPTKAVSISMDVDLEKELVTNWQVFASVIPPVERISYDEFDNALRTGEPDDRISAEQLADIQLLSRASPILSAKLDKRTSQKKIPLIETQPHSSYASLGVTTKSISSVRLVKRQGKFPAEASKVAHVIDFRTTESHTIINSILTSTGALVRKFARENNVFLPESPNAATYVSRCGTAPLRRYADLAIQRQIKCILFGRHPAGRRRMNDLRVWLAKRHADGERIVEEKRRSALFASLSNHCAQQCAATGSTYSTLLGRIRNLSVSRKGTLRLEVMLDGTGLSTTANASATLMSQVLGKSAAADTNKSDASSARKTVPMQDVLSRARSYLPPKTKVFVKIAGVDTVAYRINAMVTGKMKSGAASE